MIDFLHMDYILSVPLVFRPGKFAGSSASSVSFFLCVNPLPHTGMLHIHTCTTGTGTCLLKLI